MELNNKLNGKNMRYLQSTTSIASTLFREGLRCCDDDVANLFNDDFDARSTVSMDTFNPVRPLK